MNIRPIKTKSESELLITSLSKANRGGLFEGMQFEGVHKGVPLEKL